MRVLVIEDQEKVASFIANGLQEEGYAVDIATTGDNGISYGMTGPYDIIILDVMLPGVNGIDVLRRLRKERVTTPIIMLTVCADTSDKIRALDGGADDYLVKPFSFAELLARLRALLRRSTDQSEIVLRLADLELNPVTRKVVRGKDRVDLSNKEFSVLEFLMRNAGRVVTRTSLLEHVWDMNFDSDTNLVDVYIRHLRRKLDDDYPEKLIHTVRGMGYVLERESER